MSQNPRYTGPNAKRFEYRSRERDINSVLELIKYAGEIVRNKDGDYTIGDARVIYKAGEAISSVKSEYTAEDRAILWTAREIEYNLENPQYRAAFFGEYARNSNEKSIQHGVELGKNRDTRKTAQRDIRKREKERKLHRLSPRAKSLIRRFSKSQAACFFAALTITGATGSIVNRIIADRHDSPKDIPSSNVDILIPEETSSSREVVVPYVDKLEPKEDDVKYILDFINYPNPDLNYLMGEWIDSDSIGGFIFECGAGSHDYPYAIRNFQDEELESRMSQVLSQENLSGGMGDLGSLEDIIMQITENPKDGETKPYGFYFYSTANTYAEANLEAEYIASFYEILQRHMQEQNPNYSIYENTFPIAIDIEENGDEKFGETQEEISKLKEQRTDAMIYLANALVERGVTTKEKGVTIYMDINRVADCSYVDYDRLIKTLEENGIRTCNWGTRALSETYGSGRIYRSIDELKYDTMNDVNNLDWMESEFAGNHTIEHTDDLNLCQIHLNQQVRGPIGQDQTVDVNITTSNNIDWMLSDDECAIETPFLSQIQMIEDKEIKKLVNRDVDDADR